MQEDFSFVERLGQLMPETFVWMQDVAGANWVNYYDVTEMTSTEVTDIIQDETGRALGVWAIDHDGKMVCAKAKRAVVISTGAFNNNRHMVNKYLGYQIASISPAANCTSTYDGIVVDVEGRVLTPEGEPIPSPYAAGLCCGSFAEQAGIFYLGGMSQCLAFDRQTGKVAAAEQPWA